MKYFIKYDHWKIYLKVKICILVAETAASKYSYVHLLQEFSINRCNEFIKIKRLIMH